MKDKMPVAARSDGRPSPSPSRQSGWSQLLSVGSTDRAMAPESIWVSGAYFFAANLLVALLFGFVESAYGLTLRYILDHELMALLYVFGPVAAYLFVRYKHAQCRQKALHPYPPMRLYEKFTTSGRAGALDYLTTGALLVLFFVFSAFKTAPGFANAVFLNLTVYGLIHTTVVAVYSVGFLMRGVDKALSLHYLLGYLSLSAFFLLKSNDPLPIFAAGFVLFIMLVLELREDSTLNEVLRGVSMFPLYVLYPLTFAFGIIPLRPLSSSVYDAFFFAHFIKYILAGVAIILFRDVMEPVGERQGRTQKMTPFDNGGRAASVLSFSVPFNAVFLSVLAWNFTAGLFLYSYSQSFWEAWNRHIARGRVGLTVFRT